MDDPAMVFVAILSGIAAVVFLGPLIYKGMHILKEFYRRSWGNQDLHNLIVWLGKRGVVEPSDRGLMERILGAARYFEREITKAETEETESTRIRTFDFFTKGGINIEEFKAILIPALDNNHGGLDGLISNEPPSNKLEHEPWLLYLYDLGSILKDSIKAKRIIIFDKYLLDSFLQSPKALKDISGYRAPLSDGDPPSREKKKGVYSDLAWSAIQTAFEIVAIHSVLWRSRERISTLYLDKAHVESNQFYDFGFYRLGKVPVIYQPTYKKNIRRRVVRERIWIGSVLMPDFQIQGFLNDFDELFKIHEAIKGNQEANLSTSKDGGRHYTDIGSTYYTENFGYIFEYFEQGYINSLKKVFKEEFSIDLEIFEMLNDRMSRIAHARQSKS